MFGIDDMAAASMVVGALSTIGGIGSQLASNNATKKNRKSNEQLAEKQFQQNKEMWNLQNQYNSPASQVARLRSAGLNPNLAYGGAGNVTGNADSTPNIDYSGAMSTPAFADPSTSIAQGLSAAQAIAQVRLSDSQSRFNEAKTTESLFDVARGKELLPHEREVMRTNALLNSAKANESYKTCEQIEQNILKIGSETKLNDEQRKVIQFTNELNSLTMNEQVRSYQISNDKELASIREINKKMSVYDAQVSEIAASIKQMYANIDLMATQGRNNKAQWSLLQQEYRKSFHQIEILANEAKLSTKDVKWYVANKVGDIVEGLGRTAALGVGAYVGASSAGLVGKTQGR